MCGGCLSPFYTTKLVIIFDITKYFGKYFYNFFVILSVNC